MKKEEIISVLEDWNFWKKELQIGIKRSTYINRLDNLAKTNHIIALIGARRSGKSYILRQFAKSLMERGKDKNSLLIINFEDPRLGELNAKSLQFIYETYLEFMNPKEKPILFLDEVQEVIGWEKWVRTMHELGKANILISGSNAKLLSTELATLLTGRHLDLLVFPLSFKEFLLFNNIEVKDRLDIISKRIELNRLLRAYMELGSFPEVVLSSEKKETLLKYFEDVISRDLVKRYKIRKSEKIKALARFYLSNIASPITFNSLEDMIGVSADTIEKFSDYMESAYLILFLKRFSFKMKEQEKSPRKVYAIDTGLANAVGFRFAENIGRIAENIVFLELKKKQASEPDLELFYWKDPQHKEVDFVLKRNMKVTDLIQVCWDLNDKKTLKREISALISACRFFKLKEATIITSEKDGMEIVDDVKITYVPLLQWLLELER